MLEMARVKFEYFREKLGVSRSRFPPRGGDETESHYDMGED